jgi:thiamine transport system substrate-binding protein
MAGCYVFTFLGKKVEVEMVFLKRWLVILAISSLLLTGCQEEATALVVMTHDSFSVSENVVIEFEKENHVQVNFLMSGDTGSVLNRAILMKNAPVADVLYGIDNTFLSKAIAEDIFDPYESDILNQIPSKFILDPEFRALPVDYGDVCINYDKDFFRKNLIDVPTSLESLTKEEYRGLLVTENPATSSPGLAFLLATIAEYGEDGYLDYWKRLKDNGLVIVNDWETAYYTNFSGSSGQGLQPLVVSYGTSPAAEVIFSENELIEAPTASIVTPNACFRQIEFIGILRGTQKRELAEKFIDAVLSVPFQEDIPLSMFVFPVNQNAQLPDEYLEYVQVPESPAMLQPDLITENRDKWIENWRDLMLQ